MKKRSTILIVDDEISNIEIMNAVLEDDYDICFATCGEEALEIAGKTLPDLVLLDVIMPGMDGYTVFRNLKNSPLLADVPVIFTTGLNGEDAEVHGLAMGAIDYVTKPIQPTILQARVHNHIEMKRMRDQLAQMAVTDALTGLSNRRRLEQVLDVESRRMSRNEEWLSVIMVDIDFFKNYNDTYGHPLGDRCITMVGAALNRAMRRASDLIARYGGEEFACVLPGVDPDGAMIVAQEVQFQIRALDIPHRTSPIDSLVTVSIGVATAICRPGMHPDMWVSNADLQLYRSKAEGRNRISSAIFDISSCHAEIQAELALDRI